MAALLEAPIKPGNGGLYSTPSKPAQSPLEVHDGSIVIDSNSMTPGEFYLATLDGVPYLYRKNAEGEIEVYGLADY